MLYKTIVLELLTDRADLHEQLRRTRRLLPTLELMAGDLRDRHEIWKRTLAHHRPGSPPGQLASEALDLAIRDLHFPPATET